MGMFDILRCDIPLPFTFVLDGDDTFQTKSIANGLHRYRITADGRLVVDAWSDPEDFPGYPRVEPADVTGAVQFYTCGDGPGDWVEYEARFRRGLLERLSHRLNVVDLPHLPVALEVREVARAQALRRLLLDVRHRESAGLAEHSNPLADLGIERASRLACTRHVKIP